MDVALAPDSADEINEVLRDDQGRGFVAAGEESQYQVIRSRESMVVDDTQAPIVADMVKNIGNNQWLVYQMDLPQLEQCVKRELMQIQEQGIGVGDESAAQGIGLAADVMAPGVGLVAGAAVEAASAVLGGAGAGNGKASTAHAVAQDLAASGATSANFSAYRGQARTDIESRLGVESNENAVGAADGIEPPGSSSVESSVAGGLAPAGVIAAGVAPGSRHVGQIEAIGDDLALQRVGDVMVSHTRDQFTDDAWGELRTQKHDVEISYDGDGATVRSRSRARGLER